jgi:hypothetical protein
MVKVYKKTADWEVKTFANKLKWFRDAKTNTELKNIYADKYKIKLILEELNLDGLHYAKIVTHVKPIQQNHNLNVLVPIDRQLKSKEFQLTQEKIDKIISEVSTPEELWKVLKKKYDILPLTDDITPCKKYVYKLNLGWNTMVFVINNKIVKIIAGTKSFDCQYKNLFLWKKHVLQKYIKNIPPKIFAEEFIGYNMEVFEVYCIYGEPRVLSVYYESDVSYEANFKMYRSKSHDNTYSLELFENSFLMPNSKPLKRNVNNIVVNKICDYAKVFAAKFEFIRVDFYYRNNNIYFSECTFKPGALKKITWGVIGDYLSSYWTREPTHQET